MSVGSKSQSFFGYCGVGEEETYGKKVSPTEYLDIVSDGFSGDNNMVYLDTIRGRDTTDAIPGKFGDSGSIDLPADPEAIGLLLKAAFGKAKVKKQGKTSKVGVHTFSTAKKLPSLTVQLGLGDVVDVAHTGVGVDSFELEHSAGDRLSMSFDLPAKEPQEVTKETTPTYSTLRSFMYYDGSLSLFGSDRSADLQDVTMSLSNNVSGLTRGSRTPDKMTVGGREVTFDVTLDFENANTLKRFWGAADASGPQDSKVAGEIDLTYASPESIDGSDTAYSLEFNAPRCVIDTHDAQLDTNELIAENVELRALMDETAGYDVEAVLTNGRTTPY